MPSKPQKKRYAYGKRKRKETNLLHFLPLLFVIAIVPLIMRGTVINLTDLEQSVWIGSETRFDIFSYYKSIWFVIATIAATLILIWLHLENYLTIRKSRLYYIPLMIYSFFVLVSWLASEDVGLATRGFIEIFQGFFVLIAYALIVFVGMNMVRKEEELTAIAYALGVVGLITFIIGFSQWFGFDVFRLDAVQRMILPARLSSLVGNLNFTFGPRTIYATMYNTNFVGSFAAMMVPLSLGALLYFKQLNHRVYAGVFFGMMVFVWLGSNSRAGMLGVGTAIVLLLVFMTQDLKKQPKLWGIAGLTIVLIGLVMNILSDGLTFFQVSNLNPIGEVERVTSNQVARFEEVKLEDQSLIIITDQKSLNITYQNPSILFKDLDGTPLTTRFEDGRVYLDEEGYESFFFIIDTTNALVNINMYRQSFNAFISAEGFLLQGVGGVSNVIDTPRRFSPLDGFEEFASARGYIWLISIPMMLDTILVGHGPDMYVVNFPQRDFAGRLNGFFITGINDKPHNMFLQIGINTGVVSLLALMSVYGIYFLDSIKRYWKRDYETVTDYFGVVIFAAIFGYLVSGLFNDQIISVAPLFYALTGIGIAVNWLLQDDSVPNTPISKV